MSDDILINVQAIAQAVAFYLPDWTFTPTPAIPVKGDRDFEDYTTGNEWSRKGVMARRLEQATLVYRAGTIDALHSMCGQPTITLRMTYEKKLRVSGDFPHNYSPDRLYPRDAVPDTSLNVNPRKDPKKIASDITRIAGAYLEAFKKAHEKRKEDEAKKAAARLNVKKLAKALGGSDPTTNERYRHSSNDTTENWKIYQEGEWQISSYRPDHVDLQRTSCDLATAIKIAALLRQSRRANKETL